MKHCKQPSCITSHMGKGDVCGTNIDLDGVEFARQQQNLVYMDKVFSLNESNSCPILYNIDTSGNNARNFTTTLNTNKINGCNSGCGCTTNCGCGNGCGSNCTICCVCTTDSPIKLDSDAVFKIDNTRVVTEDFFLSNNSSIQPCQVTVDGYPVDFVDRFGDEYIAGTGELLTNISKKKCMERGLPTKAFMMLCNIGVWAMKLRIIVEGTVNSRGQTSRFCAEVATKPTIAITLPHSSTSNFAIPQLSLPCTVRGISPTIRFQFGACIAAQNVSLHYHGSDCDCGCNCGCDGDNDGDRGRNREPLSLRANLIIEPIVNVEVVRQSLFDISAREMIACCDDLAGAEEGCGCDCDHDCNCGHECGCGGNQGCGCDDVESEEAGDCGCENEHNHGGFEETNSASCGCGGSTPHNRPSNGSVTLPSAIQYFGGGCARF